MGEAADQLRQEIDAKRQDATDKIEQLEQKVTGAADHVQHQVEHVREQVKETFDWRKQVEERPLVALGVAFVGGAVLGGVMGGDDGHRGSDAPRYSSNTVQYAQRGSSGDGAATAGVGLGLMASLRGAAKSAGLDETINNLTTSFMTTLTERIREVADQAVPGMGEKLENAAKQGTFGDTIAEQFKTERPDATPSSSMKPPQPPTTADFARGGEMNASTING